MIPVRLLAVLRLFGAENWPILDADLEPDVKNAG